MFQFRPFPSYAYLIQRTITKYCLVGFPHSEIHGYSGYLLLPVAYRSLSRPSSAPDAKAFPLRSFQLDLVGADSVSLATAQARSLARSVAPPLPRTNASLVCARRGTGNVSVVLPDLSLEMFWFSIELCRQFNGRYFSKLLPSSLRCSTIKTNYLLLPCFSLSSHCSVFKVRPLV